MTACVGSKNRPATFKYALWSFVSDLRLWSHMVRGRLWRGDPLEELGLRAPTEAPAAPPAEAPAQTPAESVAAAASA